MIIVQLLGGLGNQMFQYALGRHLSIIHNCILKLDLSFLNNKYQNPDITPRKYELFKLNIIENIANENDISKYKNRDGWINKLKSRINPYYSIEEKQFTFNENILKSGRNTYLLNGYWQSEKYFKSIENIIRNEFQIKNPVKEKNKLIEEKIKNTISVSIHIRRCDYVSNKTVNKLFGVNLTDYYKKAIKIISKEVFEPVFFVFSDDLEWTKSNIKSDFPVFYVENDIESNDEDLKLMSACKHHIIANSSFSWWGAWLNSSRDKKVIAPSDWFTDNSIDTRDLYPEKWIKIN